jgi:spore maturation protein CgeB
MKVLYADHKYVYNDWDWRRLGQDFSAAYYLELVPLKKLIEAGGLGTVLPFWLDEEILSKGIDGMNAALLDLVRKEKPEVALFHGNALCVTEETLRAIGASTLTVFMSGDDSWRLDLAYRKFAPQFACVVTSCQAAVPKYRRLGCRRVVLMVNGVDLSTYRPLTTEKDIDVSFVGRWSRPRQKIIDYLRQQGIDVYVRGDGWPEGRVAQAEMIRTIGRSKIGLSLNPPAFTVNWRQIVRLFLRRRNFGEKGPDIKFDGQHFFRNLRAWWQKRIWQTKGRQFEIPACRTFELTHPAENLYEYFEPDQEIVFYQNLPDLARKIRYYLTHDEEREVIAERGYRRTLREHSTEQRFKKMFAQIGFPLG